MHRLAVVAMAVELHDRLSGDFDLDRAAAALDFGHSLRSDSAAMARSSGGDVGIEAQVQANGSPLANSTVTLWQASARA
jgi:hypothetical protein